MNTKQAHCFIWQVSSFVGVESLFFTERSGLLLEIFNPLTPMSDQDRISPYNINTESSRLVRRIKMKTQLGDYKLIQYQILQIEITSIVWQTVGRITNKILGVKG